jgi:S-formylglutathione hydrolase FrmB
MREDQMKKLFLLVALMVTTVPAGADVAPSCAVPLDAVAVNEVAVATCTSSALGGPAMFSYYVPPACAADHRCPVLYLLHGFGGDYRSMLGTAAQPSMFVKALSAGDRLDMILIAPDGRTVEAGPGAPAAGQESFWVDWNPRRGTWTTPPRFEEHVTSELVALVDASLPTIATRAGRAIDGVSLGGFGSFKLAMQHPDLYSSAGSISGALNLLVAPGPQPVEPVVISGASDLTLPVVHGAEVIRTPPGFPFGDPFGAFGDTVSDEAYYRGNNPLDLAMNAGSVPLRFFHNDTISRDPQRDTANFGSFATAQALESVVMPMNLEMVEALTQHGVRFEHELHPGLHSGPYWDPYIRGELEWHARHFAVEAPVPQEFDFRSVRDSFDVWGWHVAVSGRETEGFTTLWNAGRGGFVLQGAGTVEVRVPDAIGSITGVEVSGAGSYTMQSGSPTVLQFQMGPERSVTDQHAGTGATPTVRVRFVLDN